VYEDGVFMIPAVAAFVAPACVELRVPIRLVLFASENAVAVIALPVIDNFKAAAACDNTTSLTTDVVIVPETDLDNLK
jgi:hypothetical protein